MLAVATLGRNKVTGTSSAKRPSSDTCVSARYLVHRLNFTRLASPSKEKGPHVGPELAKEGLEPSSRHADGERTPNQIEGLFAMGSKTC
jgi:hypothetical protein